MLENEAAETEDNTKIVSPRKKLKSWSMSNQIKILLQKVGVNIITKSPEIFLLNSANHQFILGEFKRISANVSLAQNESNAIDPLFLVVEQMKQALSPAFVLLNHLRVFSEISESGLYTVKKLNIHQNNFLKKSFFSFFLLFFVY